MSLNGVVDTRFAEFSPYDAAEGRVCSTPSPLGAVMHIDMKFGSSLANPDDGSVVLSDITTDHWVFSTIWTPDDGNHPVTGNRAFGFVRASETGNHPP